MQEASRELTYAQAVNEALAEEMRRDPTVCIFGEDVAEAGTPFRFSQDRSGSGSIGR